MAKARQVAKIFDNDEIVEDDVDPHDSRIEPDNMVSPDCRQPSATLHV